MGRFIVFADDAERSGTSPALTRETRYTFARTVIQKKDELCGAQIGHKAREKEWRD